MRLLILCFLGIIATSVGTIMFDSTVQYVCQTAFLIVAAISVLLGLSGHFNESR